MSHLLKTFTAKLLQQRLQFIRFLSILETNPPKNLDTAADELDKEVWREINCMWEAYKKGFTSYLQLEKSLSEHTVDAYGNDWKKNTCALRKK